jgi:hypothetical protein
MPVYARKAASSARLTSTSEPGFDPAANKQRGAKTTR